MKQALFQFTSDSLASASRGFIDKLGLKYTKSSDNLIPKAALINKLKSTKAVEEAFGVVTGIYLVGLIDERSFTKRNEIVDYDSAIRETEQGKYEGILIFACEINKDTKVTRTTAANLTRIFNKLATNKPVILITRQDEKLTLSTCERTDKKRDAGEKMGKVNILQNINCIEPQTGHIRILESLQVDSRINTFDTLYKHWFEVFNTKTLTNHFYKDLYNWFMWVVNDVNAHFPENNHLPEHENEKKNVKIIRLITRLLFVWFLKEKKVNNGQLGLVPNKLFDIKELGKILNDFDPNSETNGEYYNAILQNLFFATLNNEISERRFLDTSTFYQSKKGYTVKNLFRDNKGDGKSWFKISHDEVMELFKTVPFLNCGLFECLDKYKRTDISYDIDRLFDGFSTKGGDKFRACLPNRLFFADELPEITYNVTEKGKKIPIRIKSKGIINILNEYVFTVEENTPLEQQVSLDPELLGKVFENLLAAYNPETEESARKSSGSYYTPREIVEYMVNESLIQYLKTKMEADEETVRQLRNLVNPSNPDFCLNERQVETILEALYNCKILDPACGSGAFPMGLLQQMVHIIKRLDDDNEKWQKLITKKATEESAKAFENEEITDEERKEIIAEITNTFNNSKNNPDYTRKLYLIQNCIFGVDIQPIAMMISKLRFFISLICEQDDNAIDFNNAGNNFGINPLPNLETKFVAANSLLTPEARKFTGDWTNDDHLEELKDELMELRYRHVIARSMKEKMNIRTLDDKKRQEINDYILSTRAHANQTKISMCQDKIAHLMLERTQYEGENIVEEYIDVQANLFEEVSRELVRKDINKIKRDEIDRQIRICQAEIEREKAKENISGFEAAVKQLTEWNPYDQIKSSPFFDSEWMFGIPNGFNIVIGNPPYIRRTSINDEDKKRYELIYKSATKQYDMYLLFIEKGLMELTSRGYLCFINPIRFFNADYGLGCRKLIAHKYKLKSVLDVSQLSVFQNAMTYPCVMLLQNEKNDLEKNVISYKLLQDLNDLSLVNDLDSIDSIQQRIISDCEKRFFIYLEREMYDIMKKVDERGVKLSEYFNIARGLANKKVRFNTPVYKALKSTNVKRYSIEGELQNIDTDDADVFKEEMIILPRTVTYLQAMIKEKDIVCLDRIYYLTNIVDINLYYVLGILNAKITNEWFESNYKTAKVSGNFFDLNGNQIGAIHIPNNQNKPDHITPLVKNILSAKKKNPHIDTTKWEEEIDEWVYVLYGLSYDEVKIVDPNFRLSQEAYEKMLAEK